jgi:hypothetical protein
MLTADQLADFFAQKGWKYRLDRENNAVRADFDVRGGNVRLTVRINQDSETVSFIIQGVGQVTDSRKAECLEALMHINYNTVLGKYTRDASDGEVTYELAVPINKSDFSFSQFERCMLVALGTVNRYGYLIPKIVFGRMDPLQAIEDEEREATTGQSEHA